MKKQRLIFSATLHYIMFHFCTTSPKEKPEASASGLSFGLLYSLLTNDLVDEQKAPSAARHLTASLRSRKLAQLTARSDGRWVNSAQARRGSLVQVQQGEPNKKQIAKGGLLFVSLLLDFDINTAPRSGRGKCACALMSELASVSSEFS